MYNNQVISSFHWFSNKQAAVMQIENENYSFKQFRAASHPYYLPEFQDAISFAVPFLMDKSNC